MCAGDRVAAALEHHARDQGDSAATPKIAPACAVLVPRSRGSARSSAGCARAARPGCRAPRPTRARAGRAAPAGRAADPTTHSTAMSRPPGSTRATIRCRGSWVPATTTASTATTSSALQRRGRARPRGRSAAAPPRVPKASRTTSTTVWMAMPPRMLPTATPTLPRQRRAGGDGDLGQVGRDREQDQPAQRGAQVQPGRRVRRSGSDSAMPAIQITAAAAATKIREVAHRGSDSTDLHSDVDVVQARHDPSLARRPRWRCHSSPTIAPRRGDSTGRPPVPQPATSRRSCPGVRGRGRTVGAEGRGDDPEAVQRGVRVVPGGRVMRRRGPPRRRASWRRARGRSPDSRARRPPRSGAGTCTCGALDPRLHR